MKRHPNVKQEEPTEVIKHEEGIKSEQPQQEEEVAVEGSFASFAHEESVRKRPKMEDGVLPVGDGSESRSISSSVTVKSENVKEEGIVKGEEEEGVMDELNRNQVAVKIQVKTDDDDDDNNNVVDNSDNFVSENLGRLVKVEGSHTIMDQSKGGKTLDGEKSNEKEDREQTFDTSMDNEDDDQDESKAEQPSPADDNREDNVEKPGKEYLEERPQAKSGHHQDKKGMKQEDKAITSKTIPDDMDDDTVTNSLRTKVDADGMYAFCCCSCKCKPKGRKRVCHSVKNNCANSSGDDGRGNTKLYHRGCCHNFRKLHADYLSPVQISIDTALEALGMETEEVSTSTTDILKRYKKGLRNAVQLEHAQWDNDDIHSIYSNPAHNRYSQDFHQRTVDEKRKEPLRVLDLFSGVGSATIVLKKLKIPLCTVVHVEHDPVAVEVCKFHHDNDGIRHVYVEAFEEIYGSGKDPDEDIVTRFIEDYGPFDLVLASPPYQNISPANGRKASKESVQYVARVGLLIQKMNDIQRQKHHVTHDILFLSESILLRKDMESSNDTLEAINQSYGAMDGSGVAPIHLDAKDFSPCKRRSFYWCNLPIKNMESIKDVAGRVSVDVCLDEGFLMVENVLESEGLRQHPPHTVIKANTFMSSLSTIDDERMMKIKKESGKYYIHTYSIREREKMLGFPLGYVQDAVNHLYHSLTGDAFLKPETKEGTSHRDFLDPSLWHFRKKCNFQFKPRFGEPPFFQIEMSAPREGTQSPEYFDEESYCKHLLGNAWSLPVVEHLLEPLQDLFEKEDLETYEHYDYSYPWEPYASKGRTETSAPEAEI